MENSAITKKLAEVIPLVMPTRETEKGGITSPQSQPELKLSGQEIDEILEKLGVGKRFVHCSFSNYEGPPRYFVTTAIQKKPLPWIYIYGRTGCGKTHLAVSIIRYLYESDRINSGGKRRSIEFANVAELLFEIRHTYDSGRFGETEWQHMMRFKNADVLILDDLGAERTNDWALDVIYRIILHRDKNGLVTITTSNYDPGEIEKIHGAPVASRICQGVIIKIESDDYRKKR